MIGGFAVGFREKTAAGEGLVVIDIVDATNGGQNLSTRRIKSIGAP